MGGRKKLAVNTQVKLSLHSVLIFDCFKGICNLRNQNRNGTDTYIWIKMKVCIKREESKRFSEQCDKVAVSRDRYFPFFFFTIAFVSL